MGYFCPHEKNAKAVKNEMIHDIYEFNNEDIVDGNAFNYNG
jgi:hypothetical protein